MITPQKSDTPDGKKVYCPPNREDVTYFGAKCVIKKELDDIRERRVKRKLSVNSELEDEKLWGLALSGGGIRSASFSLGVMQALAHKGWLNKIDYLSTVSGGGYIGSSLTWALNSVRNKFGLTEETFPFASFPMSGESRKEEERTPIESRLKAKTGEAKWSGRLLNFLRQNAKYLTPGKGLNLLTLVWIALRAAGLGLLVYGALITLVFLIAFHADLLQEVCVFSWLPEALRQNWFLFSAVLGFCFCALTVPIYSLVTFLYHWGVRGAAYPLRRGYERIAGWLLPLLLVLLLIGIVPLAHNRLSTQGKAEVTKEGQFTVTGSINSEGALSFNGTMNATTETKVLPSPRTAPCDLVPCPETQSTEKNPLWTNIRDEFKALGTGLGTLLVGILSGIMAFFKTKSVKPGKTPLGAAGGHRYRRPAVRHHPLYLYGCLCNRGNYRMQHP